MRKLKKVIRLYFGNGLSVNKTAASVNLARSTVQEYVRRATLHGIDWPLPPGLDDAQLENILYPIITPGKNYVEPDFASLHEQIKEKGVTREIVYLDYKSDCGGAETAAYSYQQFCRLYAAWAKNISVVMRQEHLAGEKLFGDFAGKTIPVVDSETGEVTFAQIFVAVLGASNYTFVTACESQKVDNWLSAHVEAFKFFGGVPELLVPDNLKSAVTKHHRYEPTLNERYNQLARHFGTTIMPARSGKPKDKAEVEKGVQFVETWIIGILRRHTFFSFDQLNLAIAALLTKLNDKPFKKLSGCRRSWFEAVDRPALKQLPANNFEDAEWLELTVGADHHVEVNRHFYSVPSMLCRKRVQARLTPFVLEILFKGNRVASHAVSHEEGKSSTLDEHRPEAHRAVNGWTVERILTWSTRVGPATRVLCSTIIDNSRHPSVGIQASLGLLSLHKAFGPERLELACRHANQSGGWTVKNIRSYFLTCALINAACRNGHTALYARSQRLMQDLAIARAAGTYRSELAKLAKLDLLAIDDFGLICLPDENSRDLLEVIDDRAPTKSTIIASQLPLDNWHQTISNPTIADAILDRVVHNSYKIKMKGDSVRPGTAFDITTAEEDA